MTTILLMGPTAAGKSALALDLAQAFGGEIVSVDSAQVYSARRISLGFGGGSALTGLPSALKRFGADSPSVRPVGLIVRA